MEFTSNYEENETGSGDSPVISTSAMENLILDSPTGNMEGFHEKPRISAGMIASQTEDSALEVTGDVLNNISSTDTGRMLAMDSSQGSMPTRTNYEKNGDFSMPWSPETLNWLSKVFRGGLNNISSTDPGRMLAMGSFQGSMPTRTNSGSDIAATSGNGSSNFKAAAENALFQSPDEMGFQQRHGLLDGDGSSSGLFPPKDQSFPIEGILVKTFVPNECLKNSIQSDHAAVMKYESTLSSLDPEFDTLHCILDLACPKFWTYRFHELRIKCLRSWTSIFTELRNQALSEEKRIAFLEIKDVLRTVCQANELPLALTWMPYIVGEGNTSLQKEKRILCIKRMACYVHNENMKEFVEACMEAYLEEGEGIAGKALQSNCLFFCHDVTKYDTSEYPFAFEAHIFGLRAAVAIRLGCTSTDDEYVLEFFLPVNVKELSEQYELLQKLYQTMKTNCKSLRIITDAELVGGEATEVPLQKEASVLNFEPAVIPQTAHVESESGFNFADRMHLNVSKPKGGDEMEADGSFEQCIGTRDKFVQYKLQSDCRSNRKNGNDDKGIDLIHSTIQKEVIPEIGMEFETEEEACNFYKTYASIVGFTVRMSKFHKENGKTIDRTFCCFREGWRTPNKQDVNVKAHRPETRCGCLAKMKINCCHSAGKYRVIEFVAGHTHEISSPSENYLLESHGKKAPAQASEVHATDISRTPPKKSPKLLGEQSRKQFRLLFTQLEKEAAKSEEKCNFIIPALHNILEEVGTKFGDERIDED